MANNNKPVQTSSAQASTFDSNLSEDTQRFHKQPNQWTQARNAVNNTISGDLGDISNEAANRLATKTPYTIIGAIHIGEDEWALFSTNNTSSEIGIFKEGTGEYNIVVNDPENTCLNFDKYNLIKGVGRSAYDCGRRVYWDDGENPSRVMDVDNPPWVEDCNNVDSCYICSTTNQLDCDKIRLAVVMTDLSFKVDTGNSSGQIINGSYYVVGAYLVEGQRVTDYSLPSNVQSLFHHDNVSGALDITVAEADPEYDEFELVLVQFANFNTVARKIGVYSTRQRTITLDQIDEKLPTIPLEEIISISSVPDKSEGIYRNGQYLMRVGPTDKFDFNYQPLANQINSEWVVTEYDAEYYRNGGHDVGYMRDEVYPFFIRWVWNTGDKTKSYHIPGRVAVTKDLVEVDNADVIDGDENIARWKIYNTAEVNPMSLVTNTLSRGPGKVIGSGKMSYWESSEIYDDDNPDVWNASSNEIWESTNPAHDLCGKPIRHHKFPDNGSDVSPNMITNHYDPVTGEKIRVMGIQFNNIKRPLDNQGRRIENIVGYEILRGSREGNKTVLAKGMINNLREYKTTDGEATKRYLYPNYPYNPTKATADLDDDIVAVSDRFLSAEATTYEAKSERYDKTNAWGAFLTGDIPLGVELPGTINKVTGKPFFSGNTNILNDMLTFHSPETNFRNPFLSVKELKVYGEMHGLMEGKFQAPKGHPRAKFITDTSFVVSAIIGIGYALLSTEGEKTVKHRGPQTDSGGTYAQGGTAIGTTGPAGISAGAMALMTASVSAAAASDAVINNVMSHSVLSLLMSAVGIDANIVRDSALQVSGNLSGLGGAGGYDQQERKVSAWGATPDLLRSIQGVPAFLTAWGEGIDKMVNIIYSFTPYRQYALQQISHCHYNKFTASKEGETRRHIDNANYLSPELQDFAKDYRINNVYRSRTVALKLANELALPKGWLNPETNERFQDDTQALYSDVWNKDLHLAKWLNDENIASSFERHASSHYVALKQRLDNQYGQLQGIIQVPVSTDITETPSVNPSKSPVLFNGDTYVGRYTEKNTMFFFYDWLKDQPDGAVLNYKLKKMITHPRFWMDTDPFDIGEFVASLGNVFQSDDAPASYDPYAVDPKYGERYITDPETGEQIDNPDWAEDAECSCEGGASVLTHCYETDTVALAEMCELREEAVQQNLYAEYLEDCACYSNTNEETKVDGEQEGPCNDDGEEEEPFIEDCNICSTCPDYDGGFLFPTTTDKQGGKYIYKGSGKFKRAIKKAKRKAEKLNKKANKIENKLYDKYMDELAGTDTTGFFNSLKERLVTPNDKYAFDMREQARFRMSVKEAFMYLFNSGVRDFFVETEINLDQRDWGNNESERHYDHIEYANLPALFSTDHIKIGNFMKYDYSLSVSKLFNNFVSWASMQDRQYNPYTAESCYVMRPKRVLYSLPQSLENKKDNWRSFLPLNYKDFNSITTAIKPIGKNGAIMLFENESPVQMVGVDTLQTDGGTKITIGDGGLFNQPLQNLVNAEYPNEYGSCQNRLSVANTPAGLYYMSQNQGKIFQVRGQGIQEISSQGMKWWFAKYLPYKLTQHPTAFIGKDGQVRQFDLADNPVIGVGCQTIYDNENSIVFFCKKDWSIRTDIADIVEYVHGNKFKVNNTLTVELGDPRYFTPASWTVSWDPKADQGRGAWLSYHDWHPDLVLPTKKTYMTTKDNGLWVHADRCDLYCNFYGKDYPFEIEYTQHTATQVTTLRNVMYMMEAYVYSDNCDDRFHVLDENFDEAVIYNSEQCSGLLKLNVTPKNNPVILNNFPKVNFASIDILFSKEEHKYRFNQFWDITANRGEFDAQIQRTIFVTSPNGYIKALNPNNLNYNKHELERKKFRHYKHTVLLRKKVSGNKNIVVSLAMQSNLNSPR